MPNDDSRILTTHVGQAPGIDRGRCPSQQAALVQV